MESLSLDASPSPPMHRVALRYLFHAYNVNADFSTLAQDISTLSSFGWRVVSIGIYFVAKRKGIRAYSAGAHQIAAAGCGSRFWFIIAIPISTQHAPVMTKCRNGVAHCTGKKAGTPNQSNGRLSTTVKPTSRGDRFQRGSSLYLNASTPNRMYPILMLRTQTTAA